MADGKATTPEERVEIVSEGQDLLSGTSIQQGGAFEATHTSIDVIIASLAARADIDRASGRGIRGGTVRWTAQRVLEEQRDFNRQVIVALEDLTARLDELEARMRALEAQAGQRPPTS